MRDYRRDFWELVFGPLFRLMLKYKISPGWVPLLLMWCILYFMSFRNRKTKLNNMEKYYVTLAIIFTIMTIVSQFVISIRGY